MIKKFSSFDLSSDSTVFPGNGATTRRTCGSDVAVSMMDQDGTFAMNRIFVRPLSGPISVVTFELEDVSTSSVPSF